MQFFTKTPVRLCAASLLPASTIAAFAPAFGLFYASFLFLFTLAGASVLWFLLEWLRCPTRIRHGLILVGILYLAGNIGYSTHHSQTAEGRFERLLFKPIPPSVRFISSESEMGMGGGYEAITFLISPADLDLVIHTADFKTHTAAGPSEGIFDQKIIDEAKRNGVNAAFIYKSGEPFNFVMLLVNESKDKVFLYRFRI